MLLYKTTQINSRKVTFTTLEHVGIRQTQKYLLNTANKQTEEKEIKYRQRKYTTKTRKI